MNQCVLCFAEWHLQTRHENLRFFTQFPESTVSFQCHLSSLNQWGI